MRLPHSIACAVLALAAVAASSRTGQATNAGEAREIARIRIHFDSVLATLGSRDVRGLSAERSARRHTLLLTLSAYRDRGVFPHNYDFAGQAVPYFIDRKTGTLCAVAHLLASTGRRDIVDRVAAADNNVRVAALAGDTALVSWLDENGITLDEAAFIQVPYMQPTTKAEEVRQTAFFTVAPLAVGGALVISALNLTGNLDGHHTTLSRIGVIAGATTVLMGSALTAKTNLLGVGTSGIAIGLTTLATSLRAMQQHSLVLAAQRKAETERTSAQTSVAPIISTSNGGSAGVAVSVRF